MLFRPALRCAPHLIECTFVPAPFSNNHHTDLAPAMGATPGAASTSPTYSMRSVAAPRLNMPSFGILTEYHGPSFGRSKKKSAEPSTRYVGLMFGTSRYPPLLHEFTAPLHCIHKSEVHLHTHANYQEYRPQWIETLGGPTLAMK